ncbi:hypothetical protein COOONC_03004 [Cooperia oncophora]
MKRLVFLLFCVYLCRGISASEADLLAALKAEEIPLEAQVLTGEKLVEYLKKRQNLFEVEITPNSHNFRSRLMDLKFINQNKNPVVDDPHDNGEDIPGTGSLVSLTGRSLKNRFGFLCDYSSRGLQFRLLDKKGSLRPVPVSVITAFTALMVEKCGPIARHSFTSVTKQTVAHAGPSPRQLRYPIAYAFIPKEKYRCKSQLQSW